MNPIARIWRGVASLFGGGQRALTAQKSVSHVTVGRVVSDDPVWITAEAGGGAGADPYTASLWVFACASLISQALASIPLGVFVGNELVEDHDLEGLFEAPTPEHDLNQWLQEWSLYLLLTGACYLEPYFYQRGRDRGLVESLWLYGEGEYRTLRSREGRRQIIGFERRHDNEKFGVDDVFLSRYVRPGARHNSRRVGVSPLEGAAREATVDRDAARWQASSFQNRVIPDGLFEIDSADLEIIRKAEAHIDEQWSDVLKARKPLVVGRNAKFVKLAQTVAEMDFVEARRDNKKAICSAFKVQTVLFDSAAATFANLDVARVLLYEHAVLPLLKIQTSTINRRIAPLYELGRKRIRVAPLLSKVDALLPLYRQRLKAGKELADLGCPAEQINRRLDLGLEGWIGWEKPRVTVAGARFAPEDVELETEAQIVDIEAARLALESEESAA